MKEIEIVQHFRVRGLRVFLNTVEYRTPHLHKELELIWILDGGMEIRGAKGMHVARTGDLAILNPKQMHALCRLDKPCSFLCIQVSPKFFAYSFPAISGLRFDELLLSRSMEDIAPLLDALALTYFRQEDGFELVCAGQMHMLLYRLLEPKDSEPDFTRGTLEGDIAPGPITFFRLQCDSEGALRAYIAQGEVLPVATRSFGGIGIFAIPEMARFYRHVLIQKPYPHHGAVAFGHHGKTLFEVFKYLGIGDIAYNQPKNLPYPTENPWE